MNKPALIIALQAVAKERGADLSWLDVDVLFGFGGLTCRITQNGETFWALSPEEEIDRLTSATTIIDMLSSADDIARIAFYTQAEAEQAQKDMACSVEFYKVERTDKGYLYLQRDDGICVQINSTLYPSLKPGTKERLSVIAGCGRC